MQITDAQTHIWEARAKEYAEAADPKAAKPSVPKQAPWPKNLPFRKEDLLAEMDAAGVSGAVLVPNSDGQGNDIALAAARAHPDRFRVMGILDLEAPDSRGKLAHWREQPGMCGIRLALRKAKFRTLLTEGRQDWVWKEAEEAQVPVMFLAKHVDMHYVYDVAKRHPGLKLTLDHLGLQREPRDAAAFNEFDQVLRLAELPNVAVKSSALPLFSSEAYPYPALHPFIRQTYDAFGPKRMFWGSDLTRQSCTYRQMVTLFTEELPWLSQEDKQWVMGRGLREWIGWA